MFSYLVLPVVVCCFICCCLHLPTLIYLPLFCYTRCICYLYVYIYLFTFVVTFYLPVLPLPCLYLWFVVTDVLPFVVAVALPQLRFAFTKHGYLGYTFVAFILLVVARVLPVVVVAALFTFA